MKKKTLALILGTVMVVALAFSGCGKSSNTTADTASEESSAETTDESKETTVTDTTDTTSEDAATEDADNGQEIMECVDSRYTFNYPHKYFTAIDGEGEHECTVSFYNEEVEQAGSNFIYINLEEGTDYETVLNEFIEKMSIENAKITECSIGVDGAKAYSVTTGELSAEGSDLNTSDTLYAVPSDDDVITIEVFRTIGPDDDTETTIDDAIASVLDTFQLINLP